MRRRSRLLTFTAAVALAAAGLAIAAPTHASAAGPTVLCANGVVDGVTICATGELQVVPVGGSGANLTFACAAYVQSPVLDTNVDCYALGADGTTKVWAANVWAPGVAAATAGSSGAQIVPLQTYKLCLSAEYVNLNGQRGSGSNGLSTLSGCISTP
jgi:hypothetical protein